MKPCGMPHHKPVRQIACITSTRLPITACGIWRRRRHLWPRTPIAGALLAAALPGNSEYWDKDTVYLFDQEGTAAGLRWGP